MCLYLCATLSCFKQLPPNFTLDFVLLSFIDGARLLSDASEGFILSSDNLFDFHAEL